MTPGNPQLASDIQSMNNGAEAKARLKEAFEHFAEIAQDMKISQDYCKCRRNSPCLLAQGQKEMLKRFLSEFKVEAPGHVLEIDDCAAMFASSLFWGAIEKHITSERYCLKRSEREDLVSRAHDFLCLLKKDEVSEEEPDKMQIWKNFAAAQNQRRKVCIVAAYTAEMNDDVRARASLRDFQAAVIEKMRCLLQACQDAHTELQKYKSCVKLTPILQRFAPRIASWCQLIVDQLFAKTTYQKQKHTSKASITGSNSIEKPQDRIRKRLDEGLRQLSEAATLASEIAKQVSLMEPPEPEVTSEFSWSVMSDARQTFPDVEVGSVASLASCHSVDSQMSYVSGHGHGPKCFLPSYLFQVLGDQVSSVSFVRAQDGRLCDVTSELKHRELSKSAFVCIYIYNIYIYIYIYVLFKCVRCWFFFEK